VHARFAASIGSKFRCFKQIHEWYPGAMRKHLLTQILVAGAGASAIAFAPLAGANPPPPCGVDGTPACATAGDGSASVGAPGTGAQAGRDGAGVTVPGAGANTTPGGASVYVPGGTASAGRGSANFCVPNFCANAG
jgi:hypothetical protein